MPSAREVPRMRAVVTFCLIVNKSNKDGPNPLSHNRKPKTFIEELVFKENLEVIIKDTRRTHILQGTSRTSSTKPSKIMKQTDTNAALYSTSHCMNICPMVSYKSN